MKRKHWAVTFAACGGVEAHGVVAQLAKRDEEIKEGGCVCVSAQK
jgi:hypothetical protein